MTPEERLKLIPDWIEYRAGCQINSRREWDDFWYCLNELGIFPPPTIVYPIPTFNQYVQYVENQNQINLL